jgi:hypothetical protein
MKKLTTIALALAAGVAFVHAQGTIVLQQETAGLVYTNTTDIGGSAVGQIVQSASGSYYYDVLDMQSSVWAGLTVQQQAAAANLLANPSAISLWTDSGVTGDNVTTGTSKGSGIAGGNGVSAANWGAPTGATYSTGPVDDYTIVGWSASEGTSWTTVSAELAAGFIIPGFFGQTAVAYDNSGGGADSLPGVSVWGASPNGTTGLAGSGGLGTGPDGLTLFAVPVPEPATLALAGLGGLSMLFLRRRKS